MNDLFELFSVIISLCFDLLKLSLLMLEHLDDFSLLINLQVQLFDSLVHFQRPEVVKARMQLAVLETVLRELDH